MKIVRAAWDMVSFGGPRNLAASWPQREGLWTHLEATIAVYLVSSWNIDFFTLPQSPPLFSSPTQNALLPSA